MLIYLTVTTLISLFLPNQLVKQNENWGSNLYRSPSVHIRKATSFYGWVLKPWNALRQRKFPLLLHEAYIFPKLHRNTGYIKRHSHMKSGQHYDWFAGVGAKMRPIHPARMPSQIALSSHLFAGVRAGGGKCWTPFRHHARIKECTSDVWPVSTPPKTSPSLPPSPLFLPLPLLKSENRICKVRVFHARIAGCLKTLNSFLKAIGKETCRSTLTWKGLIIHSGMSILSICPLFINLLSVYVWSLPCLCYKMSRISMYNNMRIKICTGQTVDRCLEPSMFIHVAKLFTDQTVSAVFWALRCCWTFLAWSVLF